MDALDVLIHEAAREVAPALERGAHGVELVARERALEVLLAHALEGGRLVRRVRARVGIGLGLGLGLGFELEGVCLRRRDEVVQLHLSEG